MKPGFEVGLQREVSFEVTEDMCPAFDGVVVHRVCSTWTIVEFMELASRRVLVEFLENHEEGIGRHVSCEHLAPCGIGKTVRVEATLQDANPKWVVCELKAFEGDRLLATGKQVQVVMPKKTLQRIIDSASA